MSALGEGMHPWRPDMPSSPSSPWVTVDWCYPHEGALLAADSWRVIDGRVRGLERHGARFMSSVAEHRPDGERFFADVIAALPSRGDWFPRVELRARDDGTQLGLRLRATPPVDRSVVVAAAPHDPRRHPLVKGPDLDALQALRVAVQPHGAGEAVILDHRGVIVEGAYSALLWWRDGVLVRPNDSLPRIPSVTGALVLAAARAAGVPLAVEDARPADLDGCELWVLSALHGLRVATEWVDGPVLAVVPQHAAVGRSWLEQALIQITPNPNDRATPDRGTPALGGRRIIPT